MYCSNFRQQLLAFAVVLNYILEFGIDHVEDIVNIHHSGTIAQFFQKHIYLKKKLFYHHAHNVLPSLQSTANICEENSHFLVRVPTAEFRAMINASRSPGSSREGPHLFRTRQENCPWPMPYVPTYIQGDL